MEKKKRISLLSPSLATCYCYLNHLHRYHCSIHQHSTSWNATQVLPLNRRAHEARKIAALLSWTWHHYYRSGHLSRFQRAICPGFGTGTRPPGQKRWSLLSRVVEPGFEPKTYCLAYGFLANSPK